MLRIGWEKAQAKFVARNRVSKSTQSRGDGPSYILQVWDFKAKAAEKKAKFESKLNERD